MGQNLTGQTIASTYEDLVQISGSIFTDGLGNDINNITITASFATTASYAANAAGVPLALFTASFSDPNLTFTKGDSSTFSIDLSALANGTSGTSGINGTNGSSGTSGTAGSSGTSGLVLALAARNYYFTASDFTYSYLGAPYNSSGSYVDVVFSQSFDPAYDYSIDVQYVEQAGSGWFDLSQAVVFAFTNKTNSGFRLWVLPSDIPTFNPDFECYVQAISLGEESPAGPAGSNGTSGSSGTSGVSGTNGSSGTSGVSGTDGSSGTSGATGPAGAPGSSGTSGAPGTSGTSGVSGTGFPFTGNAVITGSLTVVGNYARVSGSYSGSLIDNLTTPTASEAIEHIVALSSAEYAAIVSPDPNTLYIIDSNSNPLVLGSTDFTGSVKITGSFNVVGNSLLSGSLIQGRSGNSVSDPNSAIISAGTGNTVTATQAVIIGGVDNNSNGAGGAVIAGADAVTMTGGFGLVAGAYSVTHGGTGAVTLGGQFQTMAADYSAIVAGESNDVDGNYSAIIAGKNNTIGNYTGSVILGGNNLSVVKNEEVVVPNLTVNGDLMLNGLDFSNSPANTYSSLQSDATVTYAQKLNITASATYSMHVSESGVHWVDATGLASPSTSNLNIYVYPDLMTTASQQAGVLFTYLSGSGNAVQYRTIATASASTVYYNGGINLGNSTTNLARQTNNSVRNWGNAGANPTLFTRTADGSFYLNIGGAPIPAISYIFSGSNGTAL